MASLVDLERTPSLQVGSLEGPQDIHKVEHTLVVEDNLEARSQLQGR